MKNKLSIILIILYLLNILSSCKNQRYDIDYPEIYTPEYCSNNYVDADPNLIHLYSAENSIGSIEINGGSAKYYGIKDVPLDEYLCVWESILFAPFMNKIVKKKDVNSSIQEILSYEIKSIELFWLKGDSSSNRAKYWTRLGTNRYYESVISFNEENIDAFQSYMQESIKTNNLKFPELGKSYDSIVRYDGPTEQYLLHMRVSFVKYENIVWDALIVGHEGRYYLVFYLYTANDKNPDGVWEYSYLPLSNAIEEILLSQPFMNQQP